ncbi:MAG: hypothetical protein SFV23_18995 [Planctomycetaceae bacterium]|nr:hypothetical protein [Planctomycetaceae bacterium]
MASCVRWLSCGLLLTGLLGCGGDGRPRLIPVSGTVTLDGNPLEGAIVGFQPIADAKEKFQRPPGGITDAAGKFVLGTYDKTDGAPVGKYKVVIQKREITSKLPDDFNSEMASQTNINYKWVTPKSLSDPATTNLTAEITTSGLEPSTFALTGIQPPEVERTGPQVQLNGP